jgi:outer membrane protein TolC
MIVMNNSRKTALPPASSLIVMLLAACTVGPNFVRPTPGVPPHWSARATAPPVAQDRQSSSPNVIPMSSVAERSADLNSWWSVFDDSMLTSLIERAASSNLDLRTAMLRIDEARAQRAISSAAYWPKLSVDAAYSRQRLSETTPTGSLFSSVGNLHLPGGAGISIPNPYNQYQLSANASWEIDLFGRVRRSVEAADANVQVSVEDQHSVLVSVLADVAQSYLELRGAQARLHTAKENLATIEELLDLTRQRRAAGMTTYIDVSNATAQATATRASS